MFAGMDSCQIVGIEGLKLKVLFTIDLTFNQPREFAIKIFPDFMHDFYLVESQAYQKIKIQSVYTPLIIEQGTFKDGSAPKLDPALLAF